MLVFVEPDVRCEVRESEDVLLDRSLPDDLLRDGATSSLSRR